MPAKKYAVVLDNQQEEQLKSMLQKGRWNARELKRARILLAANGNKKSDPEIAREIDCFYKTVFHVRRRFVDAGLEGALFDKPRPGQPKALDSKQEAYVIATACSEPPDGEDHWTMELLQRRLKHKKKKQVCKETIRQVLLRNKLKPHLKKNVVYTGDN